MKIFVFVLFCLMAALTYGLFMYSAYHQEFRFSVMGFISLVSSLALNMWLAFNSDKIGASRESLSK